MARRSGWPAKGRYSPRRGAQRLPERVRRRVLSCTPCPAPACRTSRMAVSFWNICPSWPSAWSTPGPSPSPRAPVDMFRRRAASGPGNPCQTTALPLATRHPHHTRARQHPNARPPTPTHSKQSAAPKPPDPQPDHPPGTTPTPPRQTQGETRQKPGLSSPQSSPHQSETEPLARGEFVPQNRRQRAGIGTPRRQAGNPKEMRARARALATHMRGRGVSPGCRDPKVVVGQHVSCTRVLANSCRV